MPKFVGGGRSFPLKFALKVTNPPSSTTISTSSKTPQVWGGVQAADQFSLFDSQQHFQFYIGYQIYAVLQCFFRIQQSKIAMNF